MNSYGYNIRLGNNGSTNHLVITNGGKFTRILGNFAGGIEIGRTAGATDNELIVTGPTSSADFGGKYVALWNAGGGNNRILVDDGALMTNVSILRVNGGNSYASITNGGRVYCTSTDVGGNYAISAARLTVGGGTGTSWLDVGGGTIQIGSDTHAADQCSVTLLSGGVITNAGVRLESFSGQVNVFNFNGGTLVAKAGGSLITTNGPTADSCKVYIQAGGAVINDNGFNASLFYTPLLEDPSSTGGGLTKLGSGELALNNPSGYTYTGLTTVSEGALRVSSFIVGSVSVASGATLSGPGNIGGSATVAGTLSPGTAGIASMDITNNLTLSGDTFIELNKDLAPSTTNDVVNVLGTLTYGGTLTITNIGASALALGDSFRVFPAGGGSSFATVQGDAGSGLAFEFNDGVVSVVSAVVTQPDLGYTVSGGAITFTWDNTGGPFTLEAQTNGLGTGLSTNWFPYPNGTNGVSVSIQPGNPSVFFRLSN
jgi:autotransporter-associated beta strand protein